MTRRSSRAPRFARSAVPTIVVAIVCLSSIGPAGALATQGSSGTANRPNDPESAGGAGATVEHRPEAKPRKQGPLFEVCPVDGPRRYVDDFGDARWFGGYHPHQGIDVFAERGSPIRAPFAGRAEESTSAAGGLGVYVYGKRGFVFNAHLERLGKLGKVKAGTVVGYVGNSGDARGSSTHDHFEWHPGGGPAVSSFKLLNAACRPRPVPRPVSVERDTL